MSFFVRGRSVHFLLSISDPVLPTIEKVEFLLICGYFWQVVNVGVGEIEFTTAYNVIKIVVQETADVAVQGVGLLHLRPEVVVGITAGVVRELEVGASET